jgi:hypothetical protein
MFGGFGIKRLNTKGLFDEPAKTEQQNQYRALA